MTNLLLFASAALAATAAFAGMYDQPYAIVESGDMSSVHKEAKLAITQVDGKSTRNSRRSDPIPPGKHVVRIHFQTARGIFRPEYRELDLDLAACTRYRIVAKYEAKTGPNWEAVVITEPIGECRRKFASAAGTVTK